MTTSPSAAATGRWTVLRLRLVLVVVTVLSIAAPATLWVLEFPDRGIGMAAGGVALIALQLRHSLAAARGQRPRHWHWTLAALVLLIYPTSLWLGTRWLEAGYVLSASALMLLRGWLAIGVAVAPMLVSIGLLLVQEAPVLPFSVTLHWLFYIVFSHAMYAASMYGTTRLVHTFEELQATQTELAELAVGRERLQISRNLHDLLGQSLSAISLKGDLAIRLLPQQPEAAEEEIRSLVGVARTALRGVRAVAHGEFAVSLRTELDGAAALLRSAGIDTRVDVELPVLPEPREEALAWVVREAVTNVLRHSEATVCWLTARRRDDTLRLEIRNDGVRATTGDPGGGSGIGGILERVAAVGGTATVEPTAGDGFRVVVDLPMDELVKEGR